MRQLGMFMLVAAGFILSLTANPTVSLAEEDQSAAMALIMTQGMLTDPSKRAEAISETEGGAAADAQVRQLAGNQANTEEMYKIASDIFASLFDQAKGDPQKMMELMAQAQSNPQAFAAGLTAQQKEAISRLAKQIEANKK